MRLEDTILYEELQRQSHVQNLGLIIVCDIIRQWMKNNGIIAIRTFGTEDEGTLVKETK